MPVHVGALAKDVLREAARSPNASVPTWRESVMGFVHAVDWGEPLIVGLLVLHALLLVGVLALRREFWAQVLIFTLITGLVSSSEALNEVAGRHWRAIATQDYFDRRGVFAGLLFAGPLLAIGLIQLVSLLQQASHYLILSKRAQIRSEIRARSAVEGKKKQ